MKPGLNLGAFGRQPLLPGLTTDRLHYSFWVEDPTVFS
jgi:hypothetical protein